jgi:GTP cyclohydrolase II
MSRSRAQAIFFGAGTEANPHNEKYLETKKAKMGHML